MAFFKPPIGTTSVGDATTINGKNENQLSVATAENANKLSNLFATEIPLTSNTTWSTTGDLLIGSGNDTAVILPVGNPNQALQVTYDNNVAWADLPGNATTLNYHYSSYFNYRFDTAIRVESMSLSTPPETIVDYGLYMISGTPTGAWSSFNDGDLVMYNPATAEWQLYAIPYDDVAVEVV